VRYGSVCSGIEAATAAWHHMGWEPAFFSEIEKFPRAVLEHHYPEVPLHGDFTTIEENQYGKIDLLVGGTPCQSFSIAGLRGGLDDDRGNLALEFCRLADRERPRWIVWENVPGVLSSGGGRDFGSILGALAEIGYGLAYRVLDAQYFGVAQRRRRVFVVGYLGDWRCAAAVLFERHSLCGHPAPSREARQDAAGGTAPRASERGGRGGDGSAVGTFECGGIGSYSSSDNSSPLLRTGADLGPGCEALIASTASDEPDVVSPALNTQSGSHHAPDTKAYVALATFNDDGTEAVESNHVVAFTQNTRDEVRYINGNGQITGALAASSGMKQTNYIAFSSKDYGADAMNDCSPTLRAGGHNGSHANAGVPPAVVYPIISDADRADSAAKTPSPDAEGRVRLRDPGLGVGGEADPMYTLQATKPHAVAYQTASREVAGTLTSNYGKQPDSSDTSLGPNLVMAFKIGAGAQAGSIGFEEEVSPTLTATDSGTQRSPGLLRYSAVRRLTPVECERLQGFPDNFTAIPWGKKAAEDCPGGPRHKALGNSMAVPVMRWIGERIQMVDDLVSVL
jgi:DNA (cytosine-5)-methyltransferase 1